MPRHLISDAHEWINEIPTVPIYYLAKPQPRERAWQNQRGKKTLNLESHILNGVNSSRRAASPATMICGWLRARQPGTGKPKGCAPPPDRGRVLRYGNPVASFDFFRGRRNARKGVGRG